MDELGVAFGYEPGEGEELAQLFDEVN